MTHENGKEARSSNSRSNPIVRESLDNFLSCHPFLLREVSCNSFGTISEDQVISLHEVLSSFSERLEGREVEHTPEQCVAFGRILDEKPKTREILFQGSGAVNITFNLVKIYQTPPRNPT